MVGGSEVIGGLETTTAVVGGGWLLVVFVRSFLFCVYLCRL